MRYNTLPNTKFDAAQNRILNGHYTDREVSNLLSFNDDDSIIGAVIRDTIATFKMKTGFSKNVLKSKVIREVVSDKRFQRTPIKDLFRVTESTETYCMQLYKTDKWSRLGISLSDKSRTNCEMCNEFISELNPAIAGSTIVDLLRAKEIELIISGTAFYVEFKKRHLSVVK
jgi:hypothetical protein